MKDLSNTEKVIAVVKLECKSKKIKRKIKKLEKKNKKLFNDNLIVHENHQGLYAKKKELCGELAAVVMAQAMVMGIAL